MLPIQILCFVASAHSDEMQRTHNAAATDSYIETLEALWPMSQLTVFASMKTPIQ